MNKFSLFLAVFSLAFFSACSDDKGPCDDGPSVSCLVGEWRLEDVSRTDGSKFAEKKGNLKFESNNVTRFDFDSGKNKTERVNSYEFKGGEADIETGGDWNVEGNVLTIKTDDGVNISATIQLNGSDVMYIRSSTKRTVISLFQDNNVETPTERFTRR